MEQAYKMRNNRYRFWYFRGVRREWWPGIVHAMCLWHHNVPVEAPPGRTREAHHSALPDISFFATGRLASGKASVMDKHNEHRRRQVRRSPQQSGQHRAQIVAGLYLQARASI